MGVVSLLEMAKGKMLPWLKSADRRTYKMYIEREMLAKNILQPTVMGTGNARRYYVEAVNIKRLNAAVKKGYTF